MDDLVQQVLAAIDAVEQAARIASPGPWHANAEHDEVVAEDGVTVCDGFALSNRQLRATVDHIVLQDPTAVLRRCAADRKLLERDGPFCDCGQRRPPTNPNTGQPIPHHYDCSAYQAAEILAVPYGIATEVDRG